MWFLPGQVQRVYAQVGATPDGRNDELIFEGDLGHQIGRSGANLIAEINQRLGFAPVSQPEQAGQPAAADAASADSGLADDAAMPPGPEAEAEAAPVSRLTQLRNDLIAVRSRMAAQGQVVDDRLVTRERQLLALIQELEAGATAEQPTVEPAQAPAGESPAETEDTPAAPDEVARQEAERLQRVQALAGAIQRTALADDAARRAALAVARGDESMRAALRIDLTRALKLTIGSELAQAILAGDVAIARDLDELLVGGPAGADELNPVHFSAEALAAWEAEAVKQARRQVREERKAEHGQIIAAAAAAAWRDSGFWQADPDELVQGMEREYLIGWQHALDGGTGSNLPPAERRTDNALRRQGYDAAVTWLGTEDGKAFVTGAKARKMQGVGEQLRRRQDERKQRLAALDVSQDDQVEAFVAALEQETERAALFPLPEVGEGQASPGLRRYLADLRQKLLPFKEWALQGAVSSSRRYRKSDSEELAFLAKAGQQRREDLRAKADYYIDQVAGFAQVFAETKTVLAAAQALHRWAHRKEDTPDDGSINFGLSQSLALRQLIGLRSDPKASGVNPSIMREPRHAAALIGTYLVKGYRTAKYQKKENEPDDTTRNQPLTRPRFDRVERIGEDYRQGRNITAEELTRAFGLKGVTYGNNVTAKQRQDHTNYTFDAFMDLANLLGIEPRHIGLGGKLTFAFGALGHGRHSAHYTPDNNGQGQAINLTNTRGDGAVAHEWFHALDWNLRPELAGEQVGAIKDLVALLSYTIPSAESIETRLDSFLSGHSQWTNMGRGTTPRDHADLYLARTIRDLEAVIERGASRDRWAGASQTQYKRQADALGQDYWGNAHELLARAGEAWVYDRLAGANNYLVSDWVEDGKVQRPTYRGQPYPSGDERAFFNDAFDQLMRAIEWTDAGPVLRVGDTTYEVFATEGHDGTWRTEFKTREEAEGYMAALIRRGAVTQDRVRIRASRANGWRDRRGIASRAPGRCAGSWRSASRRCRRASRRKSRPRRRGWRRKWSASGKRRRNGCGGSGRPCKRRRRRRPWWRRRVTGCCRRMNWRICSMRWRRNWRRSIRSPRAGRTRRRTTRWRRRDRRWSMIPTPTSLPWRGNWRRGTGRRR